MNFANLSISGSRAKTCLLMRNGGWKMAEVTNRELMLAIKELGEKLNVAIHDIEGLKSEVTEIKTDVAGMKSNMAEMKSSIAEMKSSIVKLETEQNNMRIEINENFRKLNKNADDLIDGRADI